MPDNKHCKLCRECIPKLTIHVCNEIAVEHGYCSWICLTADQNSTTINKLLRDRRDNERAATRPEFREKPH